MLNVEAKNKMLSIAFLITYAFLLNYLFFSQTFKSILSHATYDFILANGGISGYGKDSTRYISSLSDGIVFNRPGYPEFISSVVGIGTYEDWGAWTNANLSPTARLYFVDPLPSNFDVEVVAQAFGPNAEKNTIFRVGQEVRTLKIRAVPSVFEIKFRDIYNINYIEIIPPQPTSPFALSGNLLAEHDVRRLGVGLISLRILNSKSDLSE